MKKLLICLALIILLAGTVSAGKFILACHLLGGGIIIIGIYCLAINCDNEMGKDWLNNPEYSWRRDKK